MKAQIINTTVLILLAILLTYCTNNNEKYILVNNQYLNYLPSIAKKYTLICNNKEKELNKCIDVNEAYRLDKELNLLEREWGNKINLSNNANPLTKPLPITTLTNISYNINQITVVHNKVYKTNITIKFDITITEDFKNAYGGFQKNIFIYYKAVDNKGNEIAKTTSIATSFNNTDLKSGVTFSILGQLGPLAQLENFATLQLISQEEYNKKNNIKT
ncbi:MAG: hypothetical protein QM478_08180 [Flavobacteriaceae bacterium]